MSPPLLAAFPSSAWARRPPAPPDPVDVLAGGVLHESLGNVLPVLFMVNSEFLSTARESELVSTPSLVSKPISSTGATELLRSELWVGSAAASVLKNLMNMSIQTTLSIGNAYP